ncbi:MAG: hypothetical protein P1V97_15540, partial [Planctomycetota bacterium]|nr:hypothetical protein [Planctomycetota bacterium]
LKARVEKHGESPELKRELKRLEAKIKARNSRRDSRAWIDQARKESDLARAQDLCEKSVKIDPDYADAYVALGETHLKLALLRRRAGKGDECKRLLFLGKSKLDEGLKINGSHQRGYFYLAEIQSQLNAPTLEIKGNYNRAFMCDKNTWIGKLANGRLREIEGRADLAINSYTGTLLKHPGHKAALLPRAELYRRKRDYNKALADIDCVLDRLKNDPDALVLRAHVRLDESDDAAAVNDLKQALALDKGNALALGLLAHTKLRKGELEAALADCKTAQKIDRNCYYPYRVRGEIRLTRRRDRVGAEGDFRMAVQLAPRIADNHYWYGRLLEVNTDRKGALRAYNCCLDLDKKHWEALLHRATIFRVLHDYDKALKDVSEVVALRPKYGPGYLQRSKIRWVALRKGGIDYRDAQWNEVLSDLNEAIRFQPILADAYGRRGFIHRRRKMFKESLADYDRAIKVELGDVYIWHGYRGLLYAEFGKLKEAMEDFSQYLERAASTHQIYLIVKRERLRIRRELDKK